MPSDTIVFIVKCFGFIQLQSGKATAVSIHCFKEKYAAYLGRFHPFIGHEGP
jgi:hypothetical protein